MRFRPDTTFYPPPKGDGAPPERLAYVAAIDPNAAVGRPGGHDALATVDLDPGSSEFGTILGSVEVDTFGDELHHSGWNACSAALCPYAPHPHVERRFLMLPALRSSNIFVFDVKPDPRRPKLVHTVTAEEIAHKTGYSRPHTLHCGPDAIYVSALGNPAGDGPGGIFMLDCESFDVLGRWEIDRGPQFLHYDFWWHLGHDTLLSSEWGTPNMVEGGLDPERLLGKKYGHRLHVWDLRGASTSRSSISARRTRPPSSCGGPRSDARVRVRQHGGSVADLSASMLGLFREGERWHQRSSRSLAEPADPAQLPPMLQGFGAVPPLVTDINLSLDDRFLYVSCWGTGELKQYDVSDPFHPQQTGSVHLGGIVRRAAHPRSGPLRGAPQMVELSRDGKRIYFTNSLYAAWDDQFYPDGTGGWMAKVEASPGGGMTIDPDFFVDFGGRRPHQVRLEGGDSSSDSFCYP